MKPRPTSSPKRIRRSAEEARTAILDAAERRLVEAGPAGIRLQEVASDVGVSHPAVLHHFGSREALVDAVVQRAFTTLQTDIVTAIGGKATDERGMAALIERAFTALDQRGHARVMAWLALADVPVPNETMGLEPVIAATHHVRRAKREELKLAPVAAEDTAHTVLLILFALFGQAVLRERVFGGAGLPGGGDRFRSWLAELVIRHLEGEPLGAAPAIPNDPTRRS